MNRILIVEDSRDDAELLVRWLERRFEAEVICVPSAEMAYDKARGGRFQAVFVNLKLGPDMHAGIPVIRFFRALELDLPIFVVTGFEDERMRTMAIMAGASGFFGKDYTPADAKVVDTVLTMRAAALKKGQMVKKSWKTSLAGMATILSAIGGALNQLTDGNPATNPDWNVLLPLVFAGLIGIFGRDEKKSDEQVGAGVKQPPE